MPLAASRFRYPLIALFTAAALALLLELLAPLVRILEYKTIDFRFQLRDAADRNLKISEEIYHLLIDDYTHEQSLNYYWGRDKYAKIIKRMSIAQSRSVAIDVIFEGYRDVMGNLALIDAMSTASHFVLPYQFSTSADDANDTIQNAYANMLNTDRYAKSEAKLESILFSRMPIEPLIMHTNALGYANIITDDDGIIRRYPLIRKHQGRLIPSFALMILAEYAAYDLGNMFIADDDTLHLPGFLFPHQPKPVDLTIPIDQHGNLIINFAGLFLSDAYRHAAFSMHDFLAIEDDAVIRQYTQGKIGIIADTSAATQDSCTTPLERDFPNPFLYTTVLSSLLHQSYIHTISPLSHWLFMLFFPALFAFIANRNTLRQFAVFVFIVIVLYIVIALAAFVYGNYIIPLVVTVFVISFALFAVIIQRYLDDFRYHSRVEEGLRSYVSPQLLDKLKSDPQFLRPGGENKYISALFADIAGFTAFCDRSEPDIIQDALQDYFAVVVDAVFAHHGIIDKFIGDGVLAFFEYDNDPQCGAMRAVATAVQMQQTIHKNSEHWRSKYGLNLGIRIGIATGYATVGNLGLKEKFDYTIIGRKVNLASRLESFGATGQITIDEETFNEINNAFTTDRIGPISVKGFAEEVIAYKIVY